MIIVKIKMCNILCSSESIKARQSKIYPSSRLTFDRYTKNLSQNPIHKDFPSPNLYIIRNNKG